METTGVADNILQVAALPQTLHTPKKMEYSDINSDVPEGSPMVGVSPSVLIQQGTPPLEIAVEEIASLNSEPLHEHSEVASGSNFGIQGELLIVVSVLDGAVIYTAGLTQALRYPNDMWIGRSVIDLIHPEHRASFNSFIIQSLAELQPDGNIAYGQRNVYVCCLRKYRSLQNGFQVPAQPVTYLPCRITAQLKRLPQFGQNFLEECLVITAVPVCSAYKYPDETCLSPKFFTRHSANCQLIQVDPEVTPYFGFLPQDMLPRSILDFYHPEDLHLLKGVYETVIRERGRPLRSKPYRFLCQNGGFALIETELSSFINPWTQKLEFIIGHHSVLQGPLNPDVTTLCADPLPINISEEVLKETNIVKEEIKCLMNETVVRSTQTARQQLSKRCKDLAASMENQTDHRTGSTGPRVTKPPNPKVVVPTEEQSFSMLGEIFPHHDYFYSKSISGKPPSYSQLNYMESIRRFFASEPKTVSDESLGSGGDKGEKRTGRSSEEGKSLTVNCSSGSKRGDSGASLGQSTGSNRHRSDTNSNNTRKTNTKRYKSPALTKKLLSRHDKDIAKQMVQEHIRTKRDRESRVQELLKSIKKGQNNSEEESGEGMMSHGVKRSGSHSWEGEPYKAIKTPSQERAVNTLKRSYNEVGSNKSSTADDDTNYLSSFYNFLDTDKSDSMRTTENEELKIPSQEPPVDTLKPNFNEVGSNEISTDNTNYLSSFYDFLDTDKSDESVISENKKLKV